MIENLSLFFPNAVHSSSSLEESRSESVNRVPARAPIALDTITFSRGRLASDSSPRAAEPSPPPPPEASGARLGALEYGHSHWHSKIPYVAASFLRKFCLCLKITNFCEFL